MLHALDGEKLERSLVQGLKLMRGEAHRQMNVTLELTKKQKGNKEVKSVLEMEAGENNVYVKVF